MSTLAHFTVMTRALWSSSELRAWGQSPLRKNKQMDRNRSDSHQRWRSTARLRMTTGRSEARHWHKAAPALMQWTETQVQGKILPYTRAQLLSAYPKELSRTHKTVCQHKHRCLGRAAMYLHQQFTDLRSFQKKYLLSCANHCPQRAPSSCSTEN